MVRVFSWVQKVIVRRIIVVLMVSLAFLGMQSFGYSNGMLAQADTVRTPEGIYYKGTPDNVGNNSSGKNLLDKAIDTLKPNSGDNVRGNFNSDRGYYGDTRSGSGSNSSNSNIGETVRTPEGIYYKGTPDNSQIENSRNKLSNAADNIREKLNLDEDTPRATKDFLHSVKSKVGEVVNSGSRNN
ncbi:MULTISPECIES: hypothetical protein [Calothrix]|uniref:Uncharacterized protein n=2 Tax=Calothrix TaxID=1186 RepID=A0ABR8AF44_9CYAN|nr:MULTISPECIES: hypothetical protein [Calothrix]MBD2198523.1 hypothetical protein [Calothrix parietina FACHB-288]MBD2226925.1 hypothetical protein [Calothrix anomala FACHB-343]